MGAIPYNALRFATEMQIGMTPSVELSGEIEVEIVYTVRPGGAPSQDDPGYPAEVTVHALRTLRAADRIDLTWMGTTWIEEDEEMVAALLADAADREEEAKERAAEARAEDLRNGD